MNKWLKKLIGELVKRGWEFELTYDVYNNYVIKFVLYNFEPIVLTDDAPGLKRYYKELKAEK